MCWARCSAGAGGERVMAMINWVFYGLMALAVLLVLAGQMGWLSGKQPRDLGLKEGKLKRPSRTANSVSSQTALWPGAEAPGAEITPLALVPGLDGPATMARIQQVVQTMPGARVVESKPDYLYAHFTTKLLKYVDDVEFWFDPSAHAIHVRSASRLGSKDFGVNRARIEAIRQRLSTTPLK